MTGRILAVAVGLLAAGDPEGLVACTSDASLASAGRDVDWAVLGVTNEDGDTGTEVAAISLQILTTDCITLDWVDVPSGPHVTDRNGHLDTLGYISEDDAFPYGVYDATLSIDWAFADSDSSVR